MTVDPTPTNPFGCAIVLVILFLAGFFGIVSVEQGPAGVMIPQRTGVPAQAAPRPVQPVIPRVGRSPLPVGATLLSVESAMLDLQESGQALVEVSGNWPDGCDLPVEVNTIVTPEQVTVAVYRVVPPEVFCTMMLQPYSDVIDISAALASAESTIDLARVPVIVNGVTANPSTK